MDAELAGKIGKFWSQQRIAPRTRWWDSPMIRRHINALVDDEPLDSLSAGLTNRAKNLLGDRLPLRRGISVGGGNGWKEIQLIKQGLVDTVDLYELSSERIAQGLVFARQQGVEGRLRFVEADALVRVPRQESYDLVHWNNALHHMLDVDAAVAWSRSILKRGGLFYMDDYVGANRFQWSDRQLAMASAARRSLRGTNYLRNPARRSLFSRRRLPWRLQRPNLEAIRRTDPSEAAESERILSSVEEHFPGAEIIPTGGVIYHLALNDVIANFDETLEADRRRLQELLDLDRSCIEQGETHYAVCLAIKD